MRHNYVRDDTSGDHYAVGVCHTGTVLLQTQEHGDQARIQMTAEQAEHCAKLLMEAAKRIRENADMYKRHREELTRIRGEMANKL